MRKTKRWLALSVATVSTLFFNPVFAQTTVVINPTNVTYSSGTIGPAVGGYNKYNGDLNLLSGNNISNYGNGWIRFDMSGIPAGATITAASVFYNASVSSATIYIGGYATTSGSSSDPIVATGSSLYNLCYASSNYWVTAVGSSGNHTEALGATGISYIQSNYAASPVLSIIFSTSATSIVSTTTIRGYNTANISQQPSLSITYTSGPPPPVCNAPAGLAASGITTVSANLNWNAVAGATGYEYVLDQTAADPAGSGIATTATSYNPGGLTPATTYYIHVRTHCGSSNYSVWTTLSFTTGTIQVCNAPTNLNVTGITAVSAQISWNAVTGATGYEYVLDQTAANPSGAGTPTAATSHNPPGLSASTTYYFHVRTNCGGGNYSAWTTQSFTTMTAPLCNPPVNLNAALITAVSAQISWDAVTGATGYEYVLNQTAANPPGAGTPTAATGYNPSGLAGGTIYYIHLRTNCGGGNFSAWTTISFTTLPTTGIATMDEGALDFSVYPNPAFDVVIVQIDGRIGKNGALELKGLHGKLIIRQTVKANRTTVNTSQLPSGIYLLTYTEPGFQKTVKLIRR